MEENIFSNVVVAAAAIDFHGKNVTVSCEVNINNVSAKNSTISILVEIQNEWVF